LFQELAADWAGIIAAIAVIARNRRHLAMEV
jgi:hypothetical protein